MVIRCFRFGKSHRKFFGGSESKNGGLFRYTHLSFQEYLAAKALCKINIGHITGFVQGRMRYSWWEIYFIHFKQVTGENREKNNLLRRFFADLA
ncbi:MAG: hypothetical protein HQM10_25565 [Candidatus Riflebacteria bacterium]|nr:hypothetical protein [Candidatus Riflebacteria bacterium]